MNGSSGGSRMKKIFKLLSVMFVIMMLFGCTKSDSPTDVLNEKLNALRETSLYDLTDGFLGGTPQNEEEQAVYDQMEKMLKDHELTLSNERVKGKNATVDLHFKTYDFAKSYDDMIEAYVSWLFEAIQAEDAEEGFSDEYANRMLMQCWLDALKNVEKEGLTREADFTFIMEKTEEGWKVVNESFDEFVDAYMGGLFSTMGKN